MWLDQSTGQNYWSIIRPNSPIKLANLGRNHLLTPSTRFEIARQLQWATRSGNIGGSGITIKPTHNYGDLDDRRRLARAYYQFNKVIDSPLFGNINLSKFGWRHMFRLSRSKEYKDHSLNVIPYLKPILRSYPSKYWINKFEKYVRSEYEFCQYEYVLKYDNCKTVNDEMVQVVIKLREEIGYPKDWRSEVALNHRIMRKVVFKTCSMKEV